MLNAVNYMGANATKPVLGVSNKARLKPVFSAAETSLKNEILFVASLDMIISKKRITKGPSVCADAQAGLHLVVCTPRRQGFLHRGLNVTTQFQYLTF